MQLHKQLGTLRISISKGFSELSTIKKRCELNCQTLMYIRLIETDRASQVNNNNTYDFKDQPDRKMCWWQQCQHSLPDVQINAIRLP